MTTAHPSSPASRGTKTGGASSAVGAPEPAPRWEREVAVTELSDGALAIRTWGCTATDLTRSGVTLRSRPMVHTGRLLIIRVPAAGSTEPKLLYGVVADSSYLLGKGYVLAVEFCARPSPATEPLNAAAAPEG